MEALAHETLERALDYDDWLIREVETGLAQVADGQTLSHQAADDRLARKPAEHDAER
ncbi:MAG: hypothetical protein ACRD2X_11885 [Vicinamibacteraceae bacterium]